jgi:aminopeptidase YwaD
VSGATSITVIDQALQSLCVDLPHRHVGSVENRRATDYVAQAFGDFGFSVEQQTFDCIDWEHGPLLLTAGGERFTAFVGPYSLACELDAPLCAAASIGELAQVDAAGKLLLIHGDLAREQLMPRHFVFYNPAEHQQIIALIEAHEPAAIIAATARNPEATGAWYPFPLIEDGDFDIPSAYMTDVEGERLRKHVGAAVQLTFAAHRSPSAGCNVVARKPGRDPRRVVVCAHIDSKPTTPGALDNATGVATLLGLAESLQTYQGQLGLEIVALNGEDHYSAAGQMAYLAANEGRWDEIALVINMDLVGYRAGRTAWSSYGCPAPIDALLAELIAAEPEFIAGQPWYQGDHSVFIAQQVPAIAITAEHFLELCTNVTHTAADTIELVESRKLAQVAAACRQLLTGLV